MRYFKFIVVFVSLFFSSCTLTATTKNVLPRPSFLKIEKQLLVTMCHPKKKDYCINREFGASASGVVVHSHGSNSYALTAAHVCVDSQAKKMLRHYRHKMRFFVINIDNKPFHIEVVAVDTVNDLCILYVWGLDATPIRISRKAPKPADRVYNMAAPIGIFDKNMIPIFDGFYNGDAGKHAIYSLPARGGSSGSPIMNEKGELIGMISSVFVHFPQILMSPKFQVTRDFIKKQVKADMQKKQIMRLINFLRKISLG